MGRKESNQTKTNYMLIFLKYPMKLYFIFIGYLKTVGD